VKEVWEAVGADNLLALIKEMRARCEAVIDAHGGYTKVLIELCNREIRRRETSY
jgi:hypothetical protein